MESTPSFDRNSNIYSDQFDKFKRKLKIANKSENTIKSYCMFIEDFMKHANKSVSHVSVDDIEEYFVMLVDERDFKPSSVRLARMALKQFFDMTTNKNLFETIPTPKIGTRLPRFLSRLEVNRLIDSIDTERDRAITHLLYCGLRVSEVTALTFGDIDLDQRKVRVRGKGEKQRFPRLSNTAVESLRSYMNQSQRGNIPLLDAQVFDISVRRIQQFLERASRKAGIQHVTPHMLRHSFATHLLQSGVSIRYIQKLLGHSSLNTTEIYTNVVDSDLDKIRMPGDEL